MSDLHSGGFRSIPARTYVIDAAAGLLLLLSLVLPWDLGYAVSERPFILIVTLLGFCSLGLDYLLRAAIIPRTLAPAIARAKWGIVALYAANVIYLVVWDILWTIAPGSFEVGGIGIGAAVGLSGTILAAIPRVGNEEAAIRKALTVLLGVVIVWTAISLLTGLGQIFATAAGQSVPFVATSALLTLVYAGSSGGAYVVLLLLHLQRSPWFRFVCCAFASAVLGALLLTPVAGSGPAALTATLSGWGGTSIFLLPVAALAFAPRTANGSTQISAGSLLSRVGVGASACVVLTSIGTFIAVTTNPSNIGIAIVTFLLAMAALVASAIAGSAFTAAVPSPHQRVIAGSTTLFCLALVGLIVAATNRFTFSVLETFVFMVLPSALLLTVYGERLRALVRTGLATGTVQTPPRGGMPTQHVAPPNAVPAGPPAPHTPSRPTAAQVLDPALPPAEMQRIAAEFPELRVLLAANPALYPDLHRWLESLGDPAILEVLRARG